jgi:hypothetical protein
MLTNTLKTDGHCLAIAWSNADGSSAAKQVVLAPRHRWVSLRRLRISNSGGEPHFLV